MLAQEKTRVNPKVISVSELNQSVKTLLEGEFSRIQVVGEISNFVCPRSGHWYFSLKDAKAQVRCAMFNRQNKQVSFPVREGLEVLIQAKASLYPDRGDYQLIVDTMTPSGEGQLREAYLKLVQTLKQKGWFDPAYKKPIPSHPSHIGVITSPTGAAIRDILITLKRRYPLIPVTIYPSQVQGAEAKYQLVQAIQQANQHQRCDVLILARGGGSLEDLWPFNEEIVAEAIFHSQIPIVSGVGHETDTTIADWVSDHRAATPTAAAELVSPDAQIVQRQLEALERRIQQSLIQYLQHLALKLDRACAKITHPKMMLKRNQDLLENLFLKLSHSIQQQLNQVNHRLRLVMTRLHSASPMATLARGYSIVTNKNTQEVITDARKVTLHEQIDVKLNIGRLECTINTIDA